MLQHATAATPLPPLKDVKKRPISITKKPIPVTPCKEKHPLRPPQAPQTPLPQVKTKPASVSSPPHSPSSSMSLTSFTSDQLLDHSHLKPGDNASLLSYASTINMYRANAKKTNDMEIQCDFAIFLVEAAKRLEESTDNDDLTTMAATAYLMEAEKLLKQVATRGHGASQYYLGNMYSSGLLHKTNKFEFDKAFPLYVQAAKHHHPDAAYRTAKCYEDGLGTKRDKGKAVQFYRKAATLNHPGAMYRLGLAEMKGDLGRTTNIRDGHKWLKRSAEASTAEYPHALHELAHLHERGLASLIFQDHAYAVRLYHDASDLFGYAPSCFRLGECYEFGRLGCTVDPRLSMHYYGLAADQGHPHACFALTAWHLIGIPGVMEPSDELAFAWAKRAADDDDQGLPRAAYAVGYFYEVGIGIERNHSLAWAYYQKAAAQGEKRAVQRLQQEEDQQQQKQQQQPGLGSATSTSDSSLPADLSSSSSSSSLKPPPPQKKASPMNWIKRWKQKLTKSTKP